MRLETKKKKRTFTVFEYLHAVDQNPYPDTADIVNVTKVEADASRPGCLSFLYLVVKIPVSIGVDRALELKKIILIVVFFRSDV
ncbi:MAG: hypothetical protein A3C47_06290 [Omnitrophica bacterium RIFCSPHIGHO2_02_FULL_51_18]|nr:MAG: hypothetical protein A3C47_06290 [Omnitrophica bacterium RIFCSPHIGHO2_02_FULL_51_18]